MEVKADNLNPKSSPGLIQANKDLIFQSTHEMIQNLKVTSR